MSELPSQAANSVHVMFMCEALADLGHEVCLLASIETTHSDQENIHAWYGVKDNFEIINRERRIGRGGLYFYAARCVRYLSTINPDVVLSRCTPASVFAALAGWQVTHESHSAIESEGWLPLLMFKLGYRLGNIRRLVVISDALARYYEECFPRVRDKILVLPDAAKDDHPGDAGAVDRVHIPRSTPQIGYIGSLYSGRGIEIIVEMAARCPWAKFQVIGGDEDSVNAWRARTSALGNICFPGYVKPADVGAYKNECDVLLAPYQYQVRTAGDSGDTSKWMSPLKLFEYMAAGKPVICSDIPVLREVLRNDHNALLVEPDNVTEWVNALSRICRDARFAGVLARNARQDFLQKYTWHARAKGLVEELRQHEPG